MLIYLQTALHRKEIGAKID